MTKSEAVDHFWGLSFSVDNQMCVGPKESNALENETREAFKALGLTDAEIDS